MVYNWYFLFILVNYYFQVSFNLKVILYVAKITQNTVTELVPVPNAHSQEFVYVFSVVVSCTTSLKFKVSCQPSLCTGSDKKLYVSFFLMSLDETILQLLKSMRQLEKQFQRPKVCGS